MQMRSKIKISLIVALAGIFIIVIARSNPTGCIVEGKVRNIFGDPIPLAEVRLGEYFTETDELGNFSIEDLSSGLYRLKVDAKGYQKYDKEFLVDIGRNHIEIRHENGLKPLFFAVDFHVFYAPTYENNEQLFVFVGLFNGTDTRIVIKEISLYRPDDRLEATILKEELELKNGDLKKIELSGILNPIRQGLYRLDVLVLDIKKEVPDLFQFYDTAQFDDNWDFHT